MSPSDLHLPESSPVLNGRADGDQEIAHVTGEAGRGALGDPALRNGLLISNAISDAVYGRSRRLAPVIGGEGQEPRHE